MLWGNLLSKASASSMSKRRATRVTKPMAGHFAKAKVEPKRRLAEFRVDKDAVVDVGAELFRIIPFSSNDRWTFRPFAGMGLGARTHDFKNRSDTDAQTYFARPVLRMIIQQPFDTIELPYGTQVLWPDHCVQGTEGAALHKDLSIPHAELIIRKGYRKGVDSYLGVLTAQRDLFAAQQLLIQSRLARLANLVDLYRALGRYNGSLGKRQYPDLVLSRLNSRWRR